MNGAESARRTGSHRRRSASAPRSSNAGPLVLLAAAGLLLHAFVGVLGRAGVHPDRLDPLFWLSLAVIVVPSCVRACNRDADRGERLLILTAMAVALQLSRIVLYPDQFVLHDEIAHATTLDNIRDSQRLFSPTSTLPVSPFYPGLELATTAVQDLTGLASRPSAVVVLVIARMVITVSLFVLMERLCGSHRAAAVASVIYACNPQYLIFNSQYSYQTVALPLAVLVIALVQRWASERHSERATPAAASWRARTGLPALIVLVLAGVVLSHHLTGMLLVGFLTSWAAIDLLLNRGRARQLPRVGLAAAVGAAMVVVWLLVPGNPVTEYLQTIVRASAEQVASLTQGRSNRNGLFADAQGDRPPLWLRLAAVFSLVATCVLLLAALPAARVWFRRRHPLAVFLVLSALVYPAIPAGHLTPATSEVFDRSSGFLYIGLSFTVASWAVFGRHRRWVVRTAHSTAVVATVVGLLFIGGMSFGSGPQWARLPGPYLVQADARSVDSVNLAAAQWAAEELPPGSRILADRVNRLLMGSVGEQYPVTQLADHVNPSSLLLAPEFGPEDEEALLEARLDYVLVDLRGSQTLPRVGIYWENGEWGQPHDIPVTQDALRKLDAVPGIERVYDSGWVVVYGVSGWSPPVDGPPAPVELEVASD